MENIQVGVTSMRCHVEVDEMVGLKCLEAGLKLKKEFGDEGRGICDIQIAGLCLFICWFLLSVSGLIFE